MNLKFSNTPIGRLRFAAITEGISFLVLLFIAMPLKYFADFPEAVKVTGWFHGILFLLYIIALTHVKFKHQWSLIKAFVAFLASLIPFGTFFLDVQLRKDEKIINQKIQSGN